MAFGSLSRVGHGFWVKFPLGRASERVGGAAARLCWKRKHTRTRLQALILLGDVLFRNHQQERALIIKPTSGQYPRFVAHMADPCDITTIKAQLASLNVGSIAALLTEVCSVYF